MTDTVEKIGTATIQHGKLSDRVYLMKPGQEESDSLLSRIEALAVEYGYTKIFAKTPEVRASRFEMRGYRREAEIPRFYDGQETAIFWGRYLDEERGKERFPGKVKEVLDAAKARAGETPPGILDENFTWRKAGKSDAGAIVAVYDKVFESYPFPIHDPAYIRQTMDDNFVYFVVCQGARPVAVASCEMDEDRGNVEMTDFATMPEFRGKAFAVFLLDRMEEAMRERGLSTAYTIARSYSFGMNITFARMGYEYAGTLTHNTNICGQLESMNVWYKFL